MPPVTFFEYGARITGFLLVCLATRALIHYYLQLAVEVAVVGLSYYLPSDLKGIESDENVKQPKTKDLQRIIATRLAGVRQRLSDERSNYKGNQVDNRQIAPNNLTEDIAKCKDLEKSRDEKITQEKIFQLKVENKTKRRVELENKCKTINNKIQKTEKERESVDCNYRKNVYEASQMDKQIKKLQEEEDLAISKAEDDLANAMEQMKKLESTIIRLQAERNKIDEKISALKATRDKLQNEMEVIDEEILKYETKRSKLNEDITKIGGEVLKYRGNIKISLDNLMNEYTRKIECLNQDIKQFEIDHFNEYKYNLYQCKQQFGDTVCINKLNKLLENREEVGKKLADLKADYVLFH